MPKHLNKNDKQLNQYVQTTNDKEWFDCAVFLDYEDPRFWGYVETAACLYSTENSIEVRRVVYTNAALLAAETCGYFDFDEWLGFIKDFAKDNYDNGRRVD